MALLLSWFYTPEKLPYGWTSFRGAGHRVTATELNGDCEAVTSGWVTQAMLNAVSKKSPGPDPKLERVAVEEVPAGTMIWWVGAVIPTVTLAASKLKSFT
jgi:hypothetical protein